MSSEPRWLQAPPPPLLVLRGRPKMKAIATQCPTDVVVTCLTEHEGGLQIVEAVRTTGKEALWLPFLISTISDADMPRLAAGAEQVASRLRGDRSVTIHCSAGLHRTGIIAYAALRRKGLSDSDARSAICAARQQTADELDRYLCLATTLAEWPL